MYWTGSKDIKDLLGRVIAEKKDQLKGKHVADVPAGNGHTSRQLRDLGAEVVALDLFPELFKVEGLTCLAADLCDSLPLPDASVDFLIFQEGIEHLPDQIRAMSECNRVLKLGGRMILTTPNVSNLRSRLAHFLMESETLRVLPHNEIESVWLSDNSSGKYLHKYYFGHLFSVGIHKLRTFGVLSGFELIEVHPARVNWSSFILYLIFYPWIRLKISSVIKRSLRKLSLAEIPRSFAEVKKSALNLNILCSGHLILEFRKQNEVRNVVTDLRREQKLENFVT